MKAPFFFNNKLCFIITFLHSFNLAAQQNFFNVPSSDITEKNKIFFQQQFNLIQKDFTSNTTLNFGLGRESEIGINLNGLVLYDYNKLVFDDTVAPYNPFFCVNAQKKWTLTKSTDFAIGSQFGIVANDPHISGNYTWINFIKKIDNPGLKIVTGLYEISNSMVGPERRFLVKPVNLSKIGLQFGFEKCLIKDKLFAQVDFITGQHALGEIVLGGAYFISKHWAISNGIQIPTMHSTSVLAGVLEFTYIP